MNFEIIMNAFKSSTGRRCNKESSEESSEEKSSEEKSSEESSEEKELSKPSSGDALFTLVFDSNSIP